jgi:hypothetical protein
MGEMRCAFDDAQEWVWFYDSNVLRKLLMLMVDAFRRKTLKNLEIPKDVTKLKLQIDSINQLWQRIIQPEIIFTTKN